MSIDNTALQAALTRLDLPTAKDVGDFLRAEGIKGKPGRATHCPVSNYLQREAYIEGYEVCSGPLGYLYVLDLDYLDEDGGNHEIGKAIPAFPAVRDFQRQFDTGEAFQDLSDEVEA